MTISLSPTLENFVKEKVATGHYKDADEVMKKALQLLQEKELKSEELFTELNEGYEAYKAGNYEAYHPKMLRKMADNIAGKTK